MFVYQITDRPSMNSVTCARWLIVDWFSKYHYQLYTSNLQNKKERNTSISSKIQVKITKVSSYQPVLILSMARYTAFQDGVVSCYRLSGRARHIVLRLDWTGLLYPLNKTGMLCGFPEGRIDE